MISLGIDPGISGYLCLLERKAIDVDESILAFWPTPTKDGSKAGEDLDFDDEAMDGLIGGLEGRRDASPDIVVIEEQQSFPGRGPKCHVCHKPRQQQGVASTGKTMKGFGIWLGIMRARGMPLRVMRPQEWKGPFGLTADKALSTAKAQLLSPKTDFRQIERAKNPKQTRVADHNKCESYLLAKTGIRLLTGRTP